MNHTWTYNLSFGATTDPVDPRAGLSRSGHTVVAVFLGFILFFGFLNNLIVLILFCKFKTLRNPVNMLLLNISISDMLVCISGTTLSFASNIHGKWIGGEHGCRWYGFVNSCFVLFRENLTWFLYMHGMLRGQTTLLTVVGSCGVVWLGTSSGPKIFVGGIVSLISLAVLSYERYSTLTLCNKRSDDYQKALLAVGGSWVYSLLWTVPPLLGWSSYGIEGAGTSCSVRWSSESAQSTSYIICLFIFCLVIPVMVMMYCYGRLLYAVKQVGKIHKNTARKREYHVLFMVITTVICYLVCWIPYGVIALLATFGKPGVVTPVASIIPSILAKSSTVCNPIIYILMNKQFYKCFRQLFHCQPPSSTDGEPTCHSKVTVMQLNQRTDGGKLCNNEPRPETDKKVTSLLHQEPCLEPVAKAAPPV